tara:strand:+ start:2115 stop:2918 length:804 start_codon:yes stop_codon:yes gene_type:complete
MYKIPEKKHYYTMINKYEKKLYSQNGEDGVIDYIFHVIKTKTKKFVEFGFGINENNSINLIVNHDFDGLFIDGNKNTCLQSKQLYKRVTKKNIQFLNAFITKQNINGLIGRHCRGEIDFLSIDIDGNDCHILDTITYINPRVICVEFCSSIGPYRSVTVKYKPTFIRHNEHHSGMYCGGSLLGTTNIMKKKSYSLVGVVHGLNAFYVRNDILENLNDPLLLPKLNPIDSWMPHFDRTIARNISLETQYNYIKDLDWTEIDNSGNILN